MVEIGRLISAGLLGRHFWRWIVFGEHGELEASISTPCIDGSNHGRGRSSVCIPGLHDPIFKGIPGCKSTSAAASEMRMGSSSHFSNCLMLTGQGDGCSRTAVGCSCPRSACRSACLKVLGARYATLRVVRGLGACISHQGLGTILAVCSPGLSRWACGPFLPHWLSRVFQF